MIKVCFVVSGLGYSGAEIVLDRYIENNDLIDPFFIVIYQSEDIIKKYIYKYGENRVFALNIKHSKNILRFLPWIDIKKVDKEIIKYLNSIEPDIVYANNTIEVMLLSKYAKLANVMCIGHIHDMKNSIRSIIRREITQNILKYYDKILTVSYATKNEWKNNDIEVIYNGIDKNLFNNSAFDTDINSIGFVGSISDRKGVDILIEEVDNLINQGFNINIAYSNIENKKIYNKLLEKKEKYNKEIRLYENLPSSEIIKLYKDIDILIVPSRRDPLPTVVIEAISQGTLVIGNNIDGIPEMIIDNRLLFDIKENKCISNLLNRLKKIDKCELNNIKRTLYEYCYNNFNSESKKLNINSILLELISYKKS